LNNLYIKKQLIVTLSINTFTSPKFVFCTLLTYSNSKIRRQSRNTQQFIHKQKQLKLTADCKTCQNQQTASSFDVRKPVHHHTIQINQPTRCNSFTSLLLDVYVRLNMFRAPLRPSSGEYNCTRSLWFYHWSVAVGALLVVVLWDHDQQRSDRHAPTVQPEAPSAVVCSWWWAERCL